MNIINLLEQKNPLHDESIKVRKAVTVISDGLCLKYNIDKRGEEFVLMFGFLSDKNNLEAVSAWVYQSMQDITVNSMQEMLAQIEVSFENKLIQSTSDRNYG